MTNTITKPADLPKNRYITRDEYRAWQDEMYEYHAAIAHQEEQERRRQEATTAKANAYLSPAEYDQIKRQEHEENQAREAARAADQKAERDAREAYLASQPDVAEVVERSEYAFLLALQHWFDLGYTVGRRQSCWPVQRQRSWPVARTRRRRSHRRVRVTGGTR